MALGTNLPTYPAIAFTYFEPVTILAGWIMAFTDPASFLSRQLPTPPPPASISPHAIIMTTSIANMFLMQALLSLLFTVVTCEPRLTKYYLAIASVGDLGHIWANYSGMPSEVFWNFGAYNDMMVGNIFLGVFFWAMRMGTLSGVFGEIGKDV